MNYILRNMVASRVYKKIINNKTNPITISGLVCVAKSSLISALNLNDKEKVLLVTYNEMQAKRLIHDIQYFTDLVYYFPKREISAYDYDAESNEIEIERIDVLNNIKRNKAPIVVTTIEAVMQTMVTKKSLYENVMKIKVGTEVRLDEIKQKLLLLGYKRIDLVENAGEFSVRGNIIDIGINNSEGIRIELWGDEVDSVRKFKLSSQRSTDMLKNVEIYPITEKILEKNIETICKKIEKRLDNKIDEKRQELLKDIEEIKNGNYLSKVEKYFNDFYEKQENFLDYVQSYKVFFDEPVKIQQRIDSLKENYEHLVTDLLEKGKTVPDSISNLDDFEFNENQGFCLKEADAKENNFNSKEVNVLGDNLKDVQVEIESAISDKKKVIVLAGTKENRDKIAKLVDNAIKVDDIDNIVLRKGQVVISTDSLSSGF